MNNALVICDIVHREPRIIEVVQEILLNSNPGQSVSVAVKRVLKEKGFSCEVSTFGKRFSKKIVRKVVTVIRVPSGGKHTITVEE